MVKALYNTIKYSVLSCRPVIPVGLYECKITTAHPMQTIMFKNILRTFEAEISPENISFIFAAQATE